MTKRLSKEARICRDLTIAAIHNLIELPCNHPGIQPSLVALEAFVAWYGEKHAAFEQEVNAFAQAQEGLQ